MFDCTENFSRFLRNSIEHFFKVFLSLNKELLTPLHFNILDDMARNIEKLCERDSHTVYLSLGEQEMIRR